MNTAEKVKAKSISSRKESAPNSKITRKVSEGLFSMTVPKETTLLNLIVVD